MKKGFFFALAILFGLSFFGFAGVRIYKSVVFDIEVGGHLKRAADANTIELARIEMETVIAYVQKNEFTNGYTSVLWRTPDEDVGFWYRNLNASLAELHQVKENATQLEKSNVLMKLRETLVDHGQNLTVTVPPGISIFPNNTFYAMWGWLSGLVLAFFFIGFSRPDY